SGAGSGAGSGGGAGAGSGAAAGADSPTLSPTFTSPVTGALTGANVILGTAPYMSPEQARGKPVDKRSDVWAFGVVCFEMLTGRRLFDGETVSDTLAAVLKTEPDWDTLPQSTPEPFVRLLRRCLERDPRKRLRDIGEARILLEEWQRDPSSLDAPAPGPADAGAAANPRGALRALFPWVIAGVAVAAAAALWFNRPEPAAPPQLVAAIQLKHQSSLRRHGDVNIQISPNGRWLAYRTTQGIRVRPLDGTDTRLLEGTAGTAQFTFSPDGDRIAYAAAGKIRRTSIEGGGPVDVCEIGSLQPRGLAWVNDRTIVFAPRFLGGLNTVSLETGDVRELTTADVDGGERSHRWPTALPGGRSVLFLCQYNKKHYDEGDIRIVHLDGGRVTTVFREGAAPRYARSGHLLFVRDQTVFAVAMDPEKGTTSGMPVPVLSG
ncbi:MAG: protein kinase, partial [Gemmatimonadetes bacterium]|nr:protein kinase [Gemmatimonadota bacterium]